MLIDQEYTLTGTSVDYTFDVFLVDPPICDITYTYSLAEATGEPVVSVSDSRTFTFEYITDLDPLVDRLALFKDYTVTVTGTAGFHIRKCQSNVQFESEKSLPLDHHRSKPKPVRR